MFSKSSVTAGASNGNVASFQYRSTNDPGPETTEIDDQELSAEPEVRLTEQNLNDRLASERAAGYAAAQAAMQRDFEQKSDVEHQRVLKALADFDKAQKVYFSRVEAEVVQLALAIAGKILHREAQVDPMLLSAIVHLALGQLKEGSTATIRVRPEQSSQWRAHVTSLAINLDIRVVEDVDLERGDCVLETELGMVNFSLDTQLKEVERGFFDVLAQKP